MNSQSIEVNFDGLVGPTHNYSGLSYGNIASVSNQKNASNPQMAALQGLEKMKFLMDRGFKQAILPPHERPYLPLLKRSGYHGSDACILQKAYKESPSLLNACFSAAAMWTANAATVTPSTDSDNNQVHFTTANLTTKLHRAIEAKTTSRFLKKIFPDPFLFAHHHPLPAGEFFADEGAANHIRFCSQYGEPGVSLFVFGRYASHQKYTTTFPGRQTDEASFSLARQHQLDPQFTVFAQQNPLAIDAGVFHNDVIATANQSVFLYHEEAFVNQREIIDELTTKFQKRTSSDLLLIPVSKHEVSLPIAVSTYLFNSQLLTNQDQSMILLAPAECERQTEVANFIQQLIENKNNPITHVFYLNLHESMRNGGGPACLRLRVVLNPQQMAATLPSIFLTNNLYEQLKLWILRHYRDYLTPQHFNDPLLITETRAALDELTRLLHLGSIYEFQR